MIRGEHATDAWESAHIVMVEGEIVQLIAMIIRLITEGDHINGVYPPLRP